MSRAKNWLAIVTFSSALAVMGASAVIAQEERTIDQYSCMEVMKESGASRDSAIAFLHGFLLGKSGSTKFKIEELAKQTDAFIDGCLAAPTAKALDVMTKVKS